MLNPVDWMAMQKAKADTSGVYLSGGPFGQTPRMLWGLPVVLSRILAEGRFALAVWQPTAFAVVQLTDPS